MKTKLKTFGDMEAIHMGWDGENKPIEIIKVKELKQEAIKWVKEDLELVESVATHRMLERWMERFNLTYEDLK